MSWESLRWGLEPPRPLPRPLASRPGAKEGEGSGAWVSPHSAPSSDMVGGAGGRHNEGAAVWGTGRLVGGWRAADTGVALAAATPNGASPVIQSPTPLHSYSHLPAPFFLL